MWWHELIAAAAREHGWPDGYWCHVDGGPRFGLFGPSRLAVEVRDGGSDAVLGSFLLDPARRAVVAARVGPRRLAPVWKLRRWASRLLWMPVWLPARMLLPVIGAGVRASEWLMCASLRLLGDRGRQEFLAGLPPDERARVSRRCGIPQPAEPGQAEPDPAPDPARTQVSGSS